MFQKNSFDIDTYTNLILQTEEIIELVTEKKTVIDILDKVEDNPDFQIIVGHQNPESVEKRDDYSFF